MKQKLRIHIISFKLPQLNVNAIYSTCMTIIKTAQVFKSLYNLQ